jgi:methionyl-tRNA synthetase
VLAKLRELTGFMEDREFRKSATALRQLWVLGNQYLTEAAPWTAFKTDPERAGVAVRYGLNLVALFAKVSEPFIPFAAETIALSVGESFPGRWPELDGPHLLRTLEPGRPVKAPEVLFRKVENEQVAAWVERFGGAESARAASAGRRSARSWPCPCWPGPSSGRGWRCGPTASPCAARPWRC